MKGSEFPRSYHFLSQEGLLVSSCLSIGLTKMRAANVHDKGNFYAALFNLSIGLERLLKIIVVINHMHLNNLSSPDIKQLRKYGHDIEGLYDTCYEISNRFQPIAKRQSITEMQQRMLSALSAFATRTRYYNFDALSLCEDTSDPVEQWGNIFLEFWASEVSDRRKMRILGEARFTYESIASSTYTIMSGTDKEPLNTFEALVLPGVHNEAAKHVVLSIIRVLCPLRILVDEISHVTYKYEHLVFPLMGEYFQWLCDDRSHVLRKKVWP